MIVLDTHIFIWMNLQPERVPKHIVRALKGNELLGLSAISLWETSMLHSRKRITIQEPLSDWLHAATDIPCMTILPLTIEIAARAESLPIHGDPADRLIAATAMEHGCRLATVDELLVNFKQLQTVLP